MPDSEPQLKLRHEDRIFGPVSFGQVQDLLAAGKVQKTDSVREDDGPWIQIQDYLDWKAEQQVPVADISELFGDSTKPDQPSQSEKPSQPEKSSQSEKLEKPAKRASHPAPGSSSTVIPDDAPLLADSDDALPVEPSGRKPLSNDDYVPLADPEPKSQPAPEAKNELAETAEVPQTDPNTRKSKAKSGTGSVSGGRQRKRSASGGSSAANRPASSGKTANGGRSQTRSGEQRAKSGEPRVRRKKTGRSSHATQSFRLPDDADLDSILRAMATYEMTAESLDTPAEQSAKKRKRKP